MVDEDKPRRDLPVPAPGAATGKVLLYRTEDGRNRIQVVLDGGTVWMPLNRIADLFQTTKQNASLHINNILSEGELSREGTVKEYLTVQREGQREIRRKLDHYNLDMILAVGYRVRSVRGTQFRQWATERLKEFVVKGFVLDDLRLKEVNGPGVDYFDELLERIRDIRASEARVYQRIREIFTLAADYVEGHRETQVFFAFMQNKMHFAATGMTAAEIVRRRADAGKPNMGLTSWQGARVRKGDVATAKNYLSEPEIDTLNRIVVMFLDQAEFRARRRQDIHMADWGLFLDRFLSDMELPVLEGPGTLAHGEAVEWAHDQFGEFAARRRMETENQAEARYLEDLRASAEMWEKERGKSVKKKRGKERGES